VSVWWRDVDLAMRLSRREGGGWRGPPLQEEGRRLLILEANGGEANGDEACVCVVARSVDLGMHIRRRERAA
jgi:hypothetical protein